MLGSSGPGDCGKAAPISVQQKWVRVWSLSPVNEVSLGDNLNEIDWSQPTPCNLCELLPVSQAPCHHDDSVVELEASQDELDRDELTEFSLESSQDSRVLKCQLHEKCKQVKKAEKQARIQHHHSQLAETDHQLDLLRQKSSVHPPSGKSSNQPVAASTPQAIGQQEQSWLQQADLDAADAFLDQLDETPAKRSDNHNSPMDMSSKPSRKQKPAQPWFTYQSRSASTLMYQKYPPIIG